MYVLYDSATHIKHTNLEFHQSPSSHLFKTAIPAQGLCWLLDRHFVPAMHTTQFAFTITLLPTPIKGQVCLSIDNHLHDSWPMRLRTSCSDRNVSPKKPPSQQRHIPRRYRSCSSKARPGVSANKRNTTSYSSEASHSLMVKRPHALHRLTQAIVKHGYQ